MGSRVTLQLANIAMHLKNEIILFKMNENHDGLYSSGRIRHQLTIWSPKIAI